MKCTVQRIIGSSLCFLFLITISNYASLYSMEDSQIVDSSIIIEQGNEHKEIESGDDYEARNNNHGRVYNFFNRRTQCIDIFLSKPLADLPGIHTVYTKYPLSTKVGLIAFASYLVVSNSYVKKVCGKIKNCVAQLIGVTNEEDEDEDDEASPYKPQKIVQECNSQPLSINKK